MTVCVAALAARNRGIVCVADKALSYADYIQWDSDSSKIINLNPSGALVMVSGNEQAISRVMSHILAVKDQIGGRPRSDTILLCERQYAKAVEELIEAKLLRPRLLTRRDYVSSLTAPGDNHIIRALADEVAKFEIDAELLICGFDGDREPFILNLYSPGVVTDMTSTGFHAVGSGSEKAVSRLLFAEFKREHDIERALFEVFDAKANAEMAIGVGYEWDATVVLGGMLGAHDVPKDIKEIIEKVWGRANRSPFEKFDSKEHESVPRDWKEQLESFSIRVITKNVVGGQS